MSKLSFPNGFLWGASTSAYQVEGGITNDWSEWEKTNAVRLSKESYKKFGHLSHWPTIQKDAENPDNYFAKDACQHYSRFREDFDMAKSLNHNAHRFSIEWSRIEPTEGKFDDEAIKHYKEVLLALHERGMTPFVALWHWTLPIWLRDKGGVESKEFATYFERYTRYVVSHLSSDVKFWITLNEPTSVIGAAYTTGEWPPQKKNLISVFRVYHILADAHNRSYKAIHEIQKDACVGLANILHSFEPYRIYSLFDLVSIRIASFFSNEYFLLLTKGTHDYLAVQYYFHNRFKFPKRIHLGDKPESDLGWEIYPKGLYNVLKKVRRYKLPIYITENGLADADDSQRTEFIKGHLVAIHQAMQEGADVRGYFYWSLLDNFEWDKGFWPRFGLIEVDYATQKRAIRKSALEFAKICQENAV